MATCNQRGEHRARLIYADQLPGSGVVRDNDRIAYLRDHLAAVRHAVAAGVKLRGYFV